MGQNWGQRTLARIGVSVRWTASAVGFHSTDQARSREATGDAGFPLAQFARPWSRRRLAMPGLTHTLGIAAEEGLTNRQGCRRRWAAGRSTRSRKEPEKG